MRMFRKMGGWGHGKGECNGKGNGTGLGRAHFGEGGSGGKRPGSHRALAIPQHGDHRARPELHHPQRQAPGSECLAVNRNRLGFGICSPGSVRFGALQVRVRFGSVWCMAGLGSVRFCRPHGRVRFGFSALKPGSGPILTPKSNRKTRGSCMGGATRMWRG